MVLCPQANFVLSARSATWGADQKGPYPLEIRIHDVDLIGSSSNLREYSRYAIRIRHSVTILQVPRPPVFR